jgi:hypothetical protein
MNSVRLMVAANYVKFFPISYFSEAPAQILIRYSPTQFEELLPPPILEHYRRAARIRSLKRDRGGWILQDNLNLGRGVGIQFEGDSPETLYIYNLFAQEVVKMDEQSRIAHFQLTLPDEPPTTQEFGIWVNQSINSAAHAHFEALTRDLAVAARCNAMCLTNSAFSGSLLDSCTAEHSSLETDTTRLVLNLDLPFFQNVRIDDLMHARADEDAFDLFRRELEKQFRELRLEKDSQKLQVKLQNAAHELTEVQTTRVAQSVDRLRKRLAAETTVALAGLAATVATSGLSLLATLIAAAQGYKTVAEYQRSVRENPAYFLWKVRRS